MASQIIETPPHPDAWLAALGPARARYLLDWEQTHADALLADVFGYHALQLGCPALDSLRANRMTHRWTARAEFEATEGPLYETVGVPGGLWMDSRAWPWPAESLDLVVLPHTLEQSSHPHACLREVERVLIPEGQLFITGINPWSWWGWRQSRFVRQQRRQCPEGAAGQLIGCNRLRDWLGLLGFDVQVVHFSAWAPALQSPRWSWMRRIGLRWWPILGGAYLLVATKRVPGGRLVSPRHWRKVRSTAPSSVPVARTDVGGGHPRP